MVEGIIIEKTISISFADHMLEIFTNQQCLLILKFFKGYYLFLKFLKLELAPLIFSHFPGPNVARACKCTLGVALAPCGSRKAVPAMFLFLWAFLGCQLYKYRSLPHPPDFPFSLGCQHFSSELDPQRKPFLTPQSGADASVRTNFP